MHLSRRIWIQLAIFTAVALTGIMVLAFGYVKLPNLLFDAGHYDVTLQLPQAGGLYKSGNVTYRGTEVGRVTAVELTDNGVEATLNLKSGIAIPSDLDAEVHSVSAVGEQYVALLPRSGGGPMLKAGDVIPRERASVPPNISSLLDATNRGLEAIPGDNLKTAVDEAYIAVGGLGPELSRLVRGASSLAIEARDHLDELTNVIDNAAPVLNTQTDTADSVQSWAAHLANVSQQLKDNDSAVRGVLRDGPSAAGEVRDLFERVQPTLPILLSNLASIGPVLATYHASLEQLLVLIPMGTAQLQGIGVAGRNTKQDMSGLYLDFNLNLNLPPPCTTGFMPAQQQRAPALEDYPPRVAGDVYCRVPQDSMFNVRGARNYPCVSRPGKRAPTVAMCESDEQYVPLNDGVNWKGDPNSTLSGQDIPQLPLGSPPVAQPSPAPAPIAVAEYDPTTGSYLGPDGRMYTRGDLARSGGPGRTWQSLLIPPAG